MLFSTVETCSSGEGPILSTCFYSEHNPARYQRAKKSLVLTTTDGQYLFVSSEWHLRALSLDTYQVREIANYTMPTLFISPGGGSGHFGSPPDITAIAVMGSGRCALSASADGTMRVSDLESGQVLRTLHIHSIKNEHTEITSMAVASDRRRAVLALNDRTLRILDLDSEELIASFTGDADMLTCAMSPDGLTIVAGDQSGQVHFLRLEGMA